MALWRTGLRGCYAAISAAVAGSAALAGCSSAAAAPPRPTPYDIQISYTVAGAGEPLLMIMGYGSTKDMWDRRLVQALTSRYRVITFDNRGMGQTPAGDKPFTIGQFALDAVRVLDELGIEETHLMGWSLGGDIAMQLAVSHPERVRHLIVYGAHCDGGKMFPPSQEVLDALNDPSGTAAERGQRLVGLLFPAEWLEQHGQELGEIFKDVHETSDAENIAKQSQALQQWGGVCDQLASLRAPTLVLSGDRDVIVPVENARFIASRVPGASLRIVLNAGHGLMYQEPNTTADAVLSFLATSP
jgi:pimeloyl-ACP methyl ester carboxylesterase